MKNLLLLMFYKETCFYLSKNIKDSCTHLCIFETLVKRLTSHVTFTDRLLVFFFVFVLSLRPL